MNLGDRVVMNQCCECGKGWTSLIEDAIRAVNKYNSEHPSETPIKFVQIKEKFGGLRLYTNYCVEELSEYLESLEEASYSICENCGTDQNVSTKDTHGWIFTLCDKCRKEEEERFNSMFK